MPINRWYVVEGFQFFTCNMYDPIIIAPDMDHAYTVHAILKGDWKVFAALHSLVEKRDELSCVLQAEESIEQWEESYLKTGKVDIKQFLKSTYLSTETRQKILIILEKRRGFFPDTGTKNPTQDRLAFFSTLHGIYLAMPQEEKEALHTWEAQYVTGNGTCSTSDWPGWRKYLPESAFDKPVKNKEKSAVSAGYVYLIRAKTGECKIGCATNIEKRIAAFTVQPPFEYEVIHSFKADHMRKAESQLHEMYKSKHVKGEWFVLDDVDIEEIMQIAQYKEGQFSP